MAAPSTMISPSPNGTASAVRNHSGAFAWTGTAPGIETKLLRVSCVSSQVLLGLSSLPSPHGRTAQAARSSPGARRLGRARHRRRCRRVQFDEALIRCRVRVHEWVDHCIVYVEQ